MSFNYAFPLEFYCLFTPVLSEPNPSFKQTFYFFYLEFAHTVPCVLVIIFQKTTFIKGLFANFKTTHKV